MQDRARRLLSKPIKFFSEMQELFLNSSADGSLAMDANTCMNEAQADEENDYDDDLCNDLTNYAQAEDDLGDDSDTLPSPLSGMASMGSQVAEQSSSSSGIKRPRSESRPPKRDVRPKSRMSKVGDMIATTLVDLQNEIKKPAPPPPIIRNSDEIVWERLEKMTLTTGQKVMIGEYLAHKNQKGMRGFLSAASETTFESWIFKFLSDQGV
jgi:hypothetical protein